MTNKKTTGPEQTLPPTQPRADLAAAIAAALDAESRSAQSAGEAQAFDSHQGQGGLYEFVNGERRLIERTEAA